MDYIVINEDITDKYIYYNTSFYVRSNDAFGVIYIPIEYKDIRSYAHAPYLTGEDIAYDSKSINHEFGFIF